MGLFYFYFVTADSIGMLLGSGWLTTEHECEWQFVTCTDSSEVVALDMSYYGLVGRIPTELSLLTKLEFLELTRNELTGEIPSEIWSMIQLQHLILNQNFLLSGTISADVNNLRDLKTLDVSDTSLEGTMPDFLNLTQLQTIRVKNNGIHGPIPDLSASSQLCKNVHITVTMRLNAIGVTYSFFLAYSRFGASRNRLDGNNSRLYVDSYKVE
jgi:hypothetical protein